MKGIITEIERFALKDGPGIRTTVFFKGCNMACKWCHNPETLSVRPQLMIYPDKCIGCGACVEACRAGARTLGKNGALQYDRTACKHCGACAANCFSGALVMSGKEMTVEEVMEEILQDRAYYREFRRRRNTLRRRGFHAARICPGIAAGPEKGGNFHGDRDEPHAPLEASTKGMLPFLDLVMFDIKIFDEEAHRRWTGVSNRQILENAKKVAASGKPYLVRTPVIPGVNDTEEEIGSIANYVGTLGGAQYYELLLFNPLGESKYDALQMDNTFAGTRPTGEEGAARLKWVAAQTPGLSVRVG